MAKLTRKPGPGGRAIERAIKALDGQEGKVGWFPSAKYEDGTPVAGVAYVQEHGSVKNGIPPRPFMRTTKDERQPAWKDTSAGLAAQVVRGQIQPAALLQGVTQQAEGDIRRTISKISTPPLSERTIKARARRHSKGKASAKPLVDTGVMLNTLTSQVGKK